MTTERGYKMVKTIIGGINVEQWCTRYSLSNPPVNGNNGFYDYEGNWVPDKKGDETLIEITLEEVPTPDSIRLAEVLEADTVEVDYTTPVPKHDTFYKTAYSADCDDADPENSDPEITDGIIWTINISLRSAGLIVPPGGL